MTPDEIERFVDRRLRDLPSPRAPRSLAPAVMAAVRARAARPWYARPWRTWPGAWQLASALVLSTVAAGAVAVVPGLVPEAGPRLVAVVGSMAEAIRILGTMAEAGHTVASLVATSFGAVFVVPVVLMASTVAIVGSTLRRVALGGAH